MQKFRFSHSFAFIHHNCCYGRRRGRPHHSSMVPLYMKQLCAVWRLCIFSLCALCSHNQPKQNRESLAGCQMSIGDTLKERGRERVCVSAGVKVNASVDIGRRLDSSFKFNHPLLIVNKQHFLFTLLPFFSLLYLCTLLLLLALLRFVIII